MKVLVFNIRTYVRIAAYSAILTAMHAVAEKVASTTWRDEPASA
jgi:hypothetical protein